MYIYFNLISSDYSVLPKLMQNQETVTKIKNDALLLRSKYEDTEVTFP